MKTWKDYAAAIPCIIGFIVWMPILVYNAGYYSGVEYMRKEFRHPSNLAIAYPEEQIAAVLLDKFNELDYNALCEEAQIVAVKQNPVRISQIKKPSVDVQLAAVGTAGWVIQCIDDPDELVQKWAVSQDGISIGLIKNPSAHLQVVAIEQNIKAFDYIKNPCPAAIELVSNICREYSEHCPEVPIRVQLSAVRDDGYNIGYFKRPSLKVQLAAVSQSGGAIGLIVNPCEEVQLAAVKENGSAVAEIDNPSCAVQMAAVTKDRYALKYIKKPCKEVLEYCKPRKPVEEPPAPTPVIPPLPSVKPSQSPVIVSAPVVAKPKPTVTCCKRRKHRWRRCWLN